MVSRNIPFEYFFLDNVCLGGNVVAHVGSQPVWEAALDGEGRRYRFTGLATRDDFGRLDVTALQPGEWIVAPNLIYVAAG